jgi:hexosaminidase
MSNRCELDTTPQVPHTPPCVPPRAILTTALLAQFAVNAQPSLMPWPAKVQTGAGTLVIDSSFAIGITGASDDRLESAINRLRTRISRQTGTQMSAQEAAHPNLSVTCRDTGPSNPTLGEDESYVLDVAANGAQIQAPTITGALRGLETFAQLVSAGDQGFAIPTIHIEDQPRFQWRGLMIDVSRHWMPVNVIERNLDGLAAVKMNVFHWHLTDDQGFRVESKRFPQLQQLGSDGHFYTQEEIRHIIAYARSRGIRVVPEFDIPGHTTSWLVSMPQLGSAPGPYRIERTWGIFQPTLDPTREEIYSFLDAFIGEMAALFPDPYFHIGGDEVDDTQWKQSPTIQAFAKEHGLKTSLELHAYFNQRVQAIVKKHGKIMVGWDEVMNPTLPTDTVIQSWRGQESLAEAARKGYRGVLSFGYYLDHLRPTSEHYANDPMGGAARKLNDAEASKILGGEACMWSEYVSAETVDSRIWPRTAAIAERLWSPASIRDASSMYARMDRVGQVLDWVGVQHHANYGRILNELSGGRPADPVRVLVDAVEALGIVGRRDERKYTSLVALNRLVDAARPESEPIRALELCITNLASNSSTKTSNFAQINVALAQWRENHALLLPLSQHNFLAREILPI